MERGSSVIGKYRLQDAGLSAQKSSPWRDYRGRVDGKPTATGTSGLPPLGTSWRQPQGAEKPPRQRCAPAPRYPGGSARCKPQMSGGRLTTHSSERARGCLPQGGEVSEGSVCTSIKTCWALLTAGRNSSPLGCRFPRSPLSTPRPARCPGRPSAMWTQVSWLQS